MFLSIPITEKCQIFGRDTLVANERYEKIKILRSNCCTKQQLMDSDGGPVRSETSTGIFFLIIYINLMKIVCIDWLKLQKLHI